MIEQIDPKGLLHTRGDDEHASVLGWSGSEVAVLSRRCPGKQRPNEDAALVVPRGESTLLLAVADGCGGMPMADEAACRALEALASAFRAGAGDDPIAGVLAGFDAANQAVLDLRAGAGTTLAAVLIDDGVARAFHAGDSFMLVTGQRGRVRFCAKPHSPTGFGVEAGLMTEREAMAHDDRSVVLNIAGTAEMFVEISQPLKLRPRDSVVLASDGLSDNLLTAAIAGSVRTGSCAESVEALAATTQRRMATAEGHPDDLTIVLYRPLAHRS